MRGPRRSSSASSTRSVPSTPTTTTRSGLGRSRESADVDVLNLKDPGGLLTPERVRTLVPALRAAAPSVPLEVHSHMTATMGAASYLEAAQLGASFVCTAVRPLANGTSQPSAEQTAREPARSRASRSRSTTQRSPRCRRTSRRLARRLGRPVGVPLEYDVSVYAHQLPGGMTSTLRRQLAELGMEDRWQDILDELPRVREELGWPIMVTPLSQFVGVQAFLNVTTGERWSQLPDEIIRYVLGQYGPPAAAIDPDVQAKVLASPRADDLAHEEHGLGVDGRPRALWRRDQRRAAAAADDAPGGADRGDARRAGRTRTRPARPARRAVRRPGRARPRERRDPGARTAAPRAHGTRHECRSQTSRQSCSTSTAPCCTRATRAA